MSKTLKDRHLSKAITDTLLKILNEVEFLNKQSTVDCQILLEEILNRVMEKISDLSSTSSEEVQEEENKENVDPCCSSALQPTTLEDSSSGESDEYNFTWGSIDEYNTIQDY
ncbi:uncharacterized protein LOC108910598 [Anoplophora glabripennis]|uniref:uncharacterized protein LOC108910598 n=1 Tax=Anoplophora glabripennis TaxID=217634 RepID=UPI0008743DBA|nr:uncharacterized protein LOC108910598 [Anoplophora glabripennis]